MSNANYQTSLRLKNAGFPQPQPEAGQMWWIVHFVGFNAEYWKLVLLEYGKGVSENAILAPDAEYIAALLPEGCRLEIWEGRHSCKCETLETVIVTQADNFAEAAALAWLALNETETPTPDVSEAGESF